MSVISKIFGPVKKGESIQSPSESVQRLREMEEMLQKKSDFLEQKIEHEMSIAKKNSSKNKQGLRKSIIALSHINCLSPHNCRRKQGFLRPTWPLGQNFRPWPWPRSIRPRPGSHAVGYG